MDKQSALAIWQNLFGDVETAYDFASHPMKREDYQKEDSYYSWDIDAKMPYDSRPDNYIPCSLNTISFRHKKISFKVGNHVFEVRKGTKYGTFSIYDITDRNNPINMDPTQENQDPEFNKERFHKIATRETKVEETAPVRFKVPTIHSINRNVFRQHLENAELEVKENPVKTEVEENKEVVIEQNTTEEKVNEEPSKSLKEILTDSLEEMQQAEEPVFKSVTEELENPWKEEKEEEDVVVLPVPEKENKTVEKEENNKEIVQENQTALLELQQKISTYENFLKEKEERVSELQNKADLLTSQKEEILSQRNNLSTLEECFSLRIHQLNQENESLQSKLDNLCVNESNENTIIDANNALKERIISLSDENEAKNNEISNLKEEKDSLTSELEITKEANNELSQQVNIAQNEKNIFLKDKEEKEKQIFFLNEKLLENQKEIDELKIQSNDVDSLKSEKNNLLALKDTFSSYIVQMNEKEDNLLNENKQISALIAEKQNIIDQLNFQLDDLKKKDHDLNANYDQLDAQSQMIDDQMETVNSENMELRKEIDDLRAEHNDLIIQFQNQSINLDHYISGYDQMKQDKIKAESELEVIKEDRDRIQARNDVLNQQIAEKQNNLDEKESRIAQISSEADKDKKEKFEQILTLTAMKNDQANKLLFLSLNGCPENYLNVVKTISDRSLVFNEENIRLVLKEYPEWKIASVNEMNENVKAEELSNDDVSYLTKEKERHEKAINYFLHIYHNEKTEVTDFAGRTIALADFNKKDSDKGWDYCLFDKDEMESNSNVFIANLKSIRDYRRDEPFTSNGHSYYVVDDNGQKRIDSADYVTNPYDFESAVKISQINKEKKAPLVYIFVKCTPANSSDSSPKDISDYFDIMDRTVKRCCPISFVEMKTYVGNGKGNYAFITFDGSVEECYSEVLEYAMLLNSYRREFKKQGLFNAIIVVNETQVTYSKRHLDLDNLIRETGDVEMRALNYVFNMMVIDSTIKRTIHIGPSILDKLPVARDYLQPSRIGQGNFAHIYKFDKEFKTYNVIYNLNEK